MECNRAWALTDSNCARTSLVLGWFITGLFKFLHSIVQRSVLSYCSKRKHGIFVMSFSKYFLSGLSELHAPSLGHSHPLSSQIPFSPSFESLFFFYPPNAIVWSMESWMCDLTLEHGWPTIGSSVKENGFLSTSSQQLPRSSSAGAGLPGTSSLRAGFANMGLVCAVTTIVSSYAQLPCLFI